MFAILIGHLCLSLVIVILMIYIFFKDSVHKKETDRLINKIMAKSYSQYADYEVQKLVEERRAKTRVDKDDTHRV